MPNATMVCYYLILMSSTSWSTISRRVRLNLAFRLLVWREDQSRFRLFAKRRPSRIFRWVYACECIRSRSVCGRSTQKQGRTSRRLRDGAVLTSISTRRGRCQGSQGRGASCAFYCPIRTTITKTATVWTKCTRFEHPVLRRIFEKFVFLLKKEGEPLNWASQGIILSLSKITWEREI